MARVVVAMSGGVDSSVAAALLRAQGHEVIGLFMRHGHPAPAKCDSDSSRPSPIPNPQSPLPVRGADGRKQGCCSAADADDARRVAERLGVAFYALNFAPEFERLIDYFVAEYAAARTPNPCIVCNSELKFGKLLEYADGLGAEFVATGHYARRAEIAGEPAILRAVDPAKDQSYVLFGISRSALRRVLLPIGDFSKADIRHKAGELGLAVADKPDSQEICFVPDQDHARLVRARAGGPSRAGEIVTTDGKVVGQHDGYEAFTIGQRKGLGVALGEPYYVVSIDAATCRVVLGKADQLVQHMVAVERVNWLIEPPTAALDGLVQVRYRSRPTPARIEPQEGDRVQVVLQQPLYGVAPGQAAVFYDRARLVGGGWIASPQND